VAFAYAAIPIARAKKGSISQSDSRVDMMLTESCGGSITASSSVISNIALKTLSLVIEAKTGKSRLLRFPVAAKIFIILVIPK
jgi:hypothetical protein